MGLFDQGNKKKKKDDFASPVEQIDLASAPVASDSDPDEAEATGAAEREPEAPPKRRAPALHYGIDDAIALMRTLPAENVELVVRVVKHTLESTKIEIPAIIEDATAKQERLEARVKVLRDEIADFEQQIAVRKTEIGELEADHRETTEVKERLALAEKLGKPQAGAPRPILPSPSSASGPTGSGPSATAEGKGTEATRRRSPSTAPPPTPNSSRATTIVQKK